MINYYNADHIGDVILSGGTEQRNLPNGYTQVEYLESDGTQYIDTGKNFTSNIKIYMETMYLSPLSVYGWGRNAGSQEILWQNNMFYFGGGYSSTSQKVIDTKYAYDLDFTAGAMVAKINGAVVRETTNIYDTDFANRIYLFALNNRGTNIDTYYGRVYGFKYINGSTLEQNLVPAKRNSDNVVGMYDTVSGQFFTNQGTGDFIAGPTVQAPTPDHPIDIVSNNGVLKLNDNYIVPSSYTQLKYLDDNLETYIDSGLQLNGATDDVEIKVKTKYIDSSNLFGARTATTNRAYTIGYNQNEWRFGWYNTSNYYGAYKDGTHIIKIDHDGGKFYVDGELLTSNGSQSFTTPVNATIGAIISSSGSGYYSGQAKFYYVNIWRSGNLYRHFVPAKRNSDGVIGLYEVVQDRFYTNAGTGSFGDSPNESKVVANDNIERVCAHGKNFFNANQWTLLPESNVTIIDANTMRVSIKSYQENYNYFDLPSREQVMQLSFHCKTLSITGNAQFKLKLYDQSINISNLSIQLVSEGYEQDFTLRVPINATRLVFGDWAYGGSVELSNIQLELGETVTEYEPFEGYTAEAQILLKVGDYTDTQKVIGGKITRNVGIKVLDGTENWTLVTGSTAPYSLVISDFDVSASANRVNVISTHLQGISNSSSWQNYDNKITSVSQTIRIGISTITTLADFKQFLTDQYSNGTPVIVVYPLATPTIEDVDTQFMDGKYVEQISGAIDNLPIEISYIHDLKKRYITDTNGNLTEITKIYKGDILLWAK